MVKRTSFDSRVAKCIDQLREVETRAQQRRSRLGLEARGPVAARSEPPAYSD